jgi:hypothetical protein
MFRDLHHPTRYGKIEITPERTEYALPDNVVDVVDVWYTSSDGRQVYIRRREHKDVLQSSIPSTIRMQVPFDYYLKDETAPWITIVGGTEVNLGIDRNRLIFCLPIQIEGVSVINYSYIESINPLTYDSGSWTPITNLVGVPVPRIAGDDADTLRIDFNGTTTVLPSVGDYIRIGTQSYYGRVLAVIGESAIVHYSGDAGNGGGVYVNRTSVYNTSYLMPVPVRYINLLAYASIVSLYERDKRYDESNYYNAKYQEFVNKERALIKNRVRRTIT